MTLFAFWLLLIKKKGDGYINDYLHDRVDNIVFPLRKFSLRVNNESLQKKEWTRFPKTIIKGYKQGY